MKGIKLWLIIAGVLMGTGLTLGAVGTARGGTWKFRLNVKNMSVSTSDSFVTETIKVDEFETLKILSHVTDINIKPGDGYSITYHVPEDRLPKIDQNGKTLTIDADEEEGFYIFDFTFASDENPYIDITVPEKDFYGYFNLEGSTSDITIKNVNFEGDMQSSTGDIHISDAELGKLNLQTSTGDIFLNNLTVNSLKTKCSTGEVTMKNITINGDYTSETSTGDVTISSSSMDTFSLNGSTSDVKVTSSEIRKVNVKTSTGDVELSLKGEESDYSLELKSSTGDIELGSSEFEKNYTKTTDGNKSIAIHTSTGDIDIDFVK